MKDNNIYPILNKINSPADLKAMPIEDMPPLCEEIRQFLSQHVKETGGHLASNLGVVELSVALHRVFDTPKDHIIFDVGHQSYVHKLLTGRREEFCTLRQGGGISGFTKRDESPHDCFGAGHSSTSVSAAIGFAEADKLSGSDGFSVAVVGDGAFTGGMVHEALNNCKNDLNLIVILNENEMSIQKNIGGFANHIAKIRSSPNYLKTKHRTTNFLPKIPLIGKGLYAFFRDTKKAVKNLLFASNYFEDMGLFYMGPADGNDYFLTERLLYAAKNKGESVVLHLKTKKGKGDPEAEKNPAAYHGISPKGAPKVKNYSKEMGELLLPYARKDKDLVAITAAMGDSCGLTPFSLEFPERYYDTGIAEGHAATFAAGLAAAGKHPVFAVYSTFLQRAYDSVIHDIALQKLPCIFMIDRAGLAPSDGPTHHGTFDVAFLSHTPNVEIISPATFEGLSRAIGYASEFRCPVAIRYPNAGESEIIKEAFPKGYSDMAPIPYLCDDMPENVIVTYGKAAEEAILAARELREEGIPCGVLLLELLKPYNKTVDISYKYLLKTSHILFLEEGMRNGGAGMLFFDNLKTRHPRMYAERKTTLLAIDDTFVQRKKGESIYKTAGISKDDIIKAIKG